MTRVVEATGDTMTACECPQAGFCYRHQCHKSQHWWRLCQTQPESYLNWEESRGPGQDPCRVRQTPFDHAPWALTVLVITHQRLEYTKQALAALLQSDYKAFEVVVWDNASTDGTRQWLVEQFVSDPRVSIMLSNRNLGVSHPMNVVWGTAQTPLVAKVDNDTLIPADLLTKLARLHYEFPRLGVLSGCHFRPEDVNLQAESIATKKSERGDQISLFRQAHVGGCAVMMRRALFESTGKIHVRKAPTDRPFLETGWTEYQHQLDRRGFANGYPLPLTFVDHMEDTRSDHHISSEEHQQYKLAMRGQRLSDYTEQFYVSGARNWITTGNVESVGRRAPRDLRPEEVTLFIPLAGRSAVWRQLSEFLDRQTFSRTQTRLIFLDTSHDDLFSARVKHWVANCDYLDVRIIREQVGQVGLADLPRREVTPEVQKSMAQIYNRLREVVESEFVWILEDDIVPPVDVCERLLAHFNEQVVSVAAPYRSRFGDRFVAWDMAGKNYTVPDQGTRVVGGNGFGCAIVRGETIRKWVFDPAKDCDRQFYVRLGSTKSRSMVDWTCECHHGLQENYAVRTFTTASKRPKSELP